MNQKETACFINGSQYNQFTDMEKTLYVIGMIDSILILFYMVDIEKYETIRAKVKDMTSLEIRKLLDDYLKKNSRELHYCAARSFFYALDEIIPG